MLERAHVRLTKDRRRRCLFALSRSVLCRLSHNRLFPLAVRWLRNVSRSEIVIKHDIVIVLLHIARKFEVFGQKAHQLVTGSIIGDKSGL